MHQLSGSQAEKIAKEAGERALGFGPRSGPVTLDVSEVRELAIRAAMIALEKAGCLDKQNALDKKYNAQLASAADSRHAAWCKQTGRAY